MFNKDCFLCDQKGSNMDFLNVVGALTTQAAPSKTSKQVVPLNVLRFARPQCVRVLQTLLETH